VAADPGITSLVDIPGLLICSGVAAMMFFQGQLHYLCLLYQPI